MKKVFFRVLSATFFQRLVFAAMVLAIAGCSTATTPKPESAAAVDKASTGAPSVPAPSIAPTPAIAAAPDLARNPPPRMAAVNPALPTIWVAGDSTAARGAGAAQQGWAVPFADYFDKDKVNIVNRARGGRSSRTFISEGLWDGMLKEVKRGDIVLIQFGHNDGGAINDSSRARGSLPGLGEETQEIDNQITKKHEVVHTFGWHMRKMIGDTKAKGATPIVLTLTVRDIWKDGRVERGPGHYSQWSAEIARAARVPCVDVTDWVADQFDKMGQQKMAELYPRDHTHFNAAGADIHAAAVVAGLKGLRPDPAGKFFSAKGEAVAADRFAWLNLPRPADAALPSLFLIGDSTVRNGHGDGANNQWGWGDFVGKYFDEKKINVVNQAVGGLSSRTYLTQGHWDRVLGMVKPGDFVMMQFGHNDSGSPTNPPPGRASLNGVGDETLEVDERATGQRETVHAYGWYLRKFIADARAKGARPMVCSPIPRKIWKDGKIVRNKDTYAGWAEAVAKAEGVPFVDLNEIIAGRYDEMGPEKVNPLFGDEHTHTTGEGADLNAQCVIAGLKRLPEDPLEAYLSGEKP
jgi:lysophospholipase L1-like esterase